MPDQRNPIRGSERVPLFGARVLGPADPSERLEVTIHVRPRSGEAFAAMAKELITGRSARGNAHMTHEEFEQVHGADPRDLEKVEAFARMHRLAVVARDVARRAVVLAGTVGDLSEAFGVTLQSYEHAGGTYRGRVGSVHVPDELKDIVEGVFGLDDRPQAKPHFRLRGTQGNVQWHGVGNSFTPPALAKLYEFPGGATGSGQCIGIVELGGGYRPADLTTYFSDLNIAPVPQIDAVSVDHGKNRPTGSANGPDGEVMLDIEVAGAIAPGAKLAVYFAPNTDRGFLDAITTAIHDKTNKPSIISISWGGPESAWTQQAMQAFDQAFQAAAALGVTVCCAAGDNGASDGVNDGQPHVDFPASSPFVLACGGTRVQASGASISNETVWNDGPSGGATGGGVSRIFAKPTWQSSANVPSTGGPTGGRGVPDVAGDADPATGYDVRVDGVDTVIGGTSAVAPLWAGMIALVNQLKGRSVGYLNPKLYATPGSFHDITEGNNDGFTARPGWDACTGLGSPIGSKLTGLL